MLRNPLLLSLGLALLVACGDPQAPPPPIGAGDSATEDGPRFGFERIRVGGPVSDQASTGGVSWADLDDDGDADLFVTNGYDVSAETPEPQKNRLYLNAGDGTLTPVIDSPLVADDGYSSGSTWGDYDNDGDLDVFVTNQRDQDNFLYRNDGNGVFTRLHDVLPAKDGGHSYSASWVDMDVDGDLDLFVANGGLSHESVNFLYANNGDGTFTRLNEGEIVTIEGGTCGASWGDYDSDGDPDVFVTDRSSSGALAGGALYRNEGDLKFTRVDETPFSEDRFPTSAAAWGDYDNDGDLDLYVTTLYGLANLLYRNEGDGGFTRIAEGPAVVDASYAYSASWADYDNDADLDLLVANWGAAPVLYQNNGSGQLARADGHDLGRFILAAASVAWADYDRDGDVDVYVGNWPNQPGPGEKNDLYRNQTNTGHWLGIRVQGTTSNTAGIGARITTLTVLGGQEERQLREVTAHTGWRSQSDLVQHFGLGKATVVREVIVRWPSGNQDRLSEVPADQVITIIEGETEPQ